MIGLKILHTSDIHLREDSPERLEALLKVLSIAAAEHIDLLIIAGDTFDDEETADNLRPKLREIFSGNPFRILIIPGNHDQFAFNGDVHFGSDVTVALKTPCQTIDFKDARIVAIPYAEKRIVDIARELEASRVTDRQNILIAHCTLDLLGMSKEGIGNEQDCKYMPVSIEFLRSIGFDYVLAGHFHSSYKAYVVDNGKWFIYPGSPISITEREQGRRAVNLLDTSLGHKEIPLDTPYFLTIQTEVRPGKETETLKSLSAELETHREGQGIIDVEIDGFIEKSENEFAKLVESSLGTYNIRKISQTYRDITKILDDPLYRMYSDELSRSQDLDGKLREEMEKMALDSFIFLKARER